MAPRICERRCHAMKLDLVDKRNFAEPPYPTELVCISPKLVPFLFGAMWLKSQKYWWVDEINALAARKILAEQASKMLEPCGQNIVDAVDRLYMLTDLIWRGTERIRLGDGTPEDPFVIEPAIPPAPGTNSYEPQSGRDDIERTMQYVQSLATGEVNDYVSDTRNIRQQLEDILTAINNGGAAYDDAEVQALIQQIILALGA